MNESTERKRGAILSYVSIIVNTLIQFLYTPLLIRKLGQSEYGLYSLVASIISYLTIMDLGFGNAIVVYTSKYRAQNKFEEEKKLHGMFNLVFKIIGIIAGLLGVALYLNVGNIFGSNMTDVEIHKMKIMMLILSFNLFLTFYFAIYSSIISAYEKFTFRKVISILHSLLKPLLMIPLLFLGYKSIALCVIITITNIFTLLSNYLYCKKKLHISTKFLGFDKTLFKTIFGYSIWIFIQIIMDKINWNIDNFVLGVVSGTIAVSIYHIAATINQLFVNLSTAVSGVFLPKISKWIAKDIDTKKLTDEMIKIGRVQLYIILFMCTSLIIFGKDFITLWAGKEFEESYYVALILIIPICLPLVQNIGISILQAMNKYRFYSIISLIGAIFNLIISIYLAKLYGPIGSAIGTGAEMIICHLVFVNFYYHFKIKLNVLKFWKIIIFNIIKLCPSLIIAIFIKQYIPFSGLVHLILCGMVYAVLYLLNAYIFVVNEYEKGLVYEFINKFKKRSRK